MMRYPTWNSILLAIFKFNKLPVALSGFGMDLRESVPIGRAPRMLICPDIS